MSIEKDVRHSGRKALERLLALRDELRLQSHLLTLESQRELSKLETQVSAVEQRARREGEEALETLQTTAHQLTRSLNDFMTTHVNGSVGLLTSVRSLMTTNPRTCRVNDSLNTAAHLMWNEDCGTVPVVSGDGSIAGVVTDRDVCMATYFQGQPPKELSVESAMSKVLFSCAPDDSIGAALAIMAEKRVRRLPVLGPERELVGILSLADVVRWAAGLTNPAIDAALTETYAAISARTPQKLAAAAE
jgi:CBS domain-containing protein